MHDLPTWEIVVDVAVIGLMLVFLLCFLLMLLLSWWTGVSEPPAFILFIAGKIGRCFRPQQFRRTSGPAPGPLNSDPVADPLASLPRTNSDRVGG